MGDSVMDATAKLTRRGLMGLGGGFALTLVGGTAAAAAVRTWRVAAVTPWRRSSYVPLIGKSFSVSGYDSPLRLLSVEDLIARPAGSENAFLLRFQSAAGAGPLPAGLPSLHHPALGRFPLFLTTGKVLSSGRRFMAVIDRTHG
jgi:hypothetical protein